MSRIDGPRFPHTNPKLKKSHRLCLIRIFCNIKTKISGYQPDSHKVCQGKSIIILVPEIVCIGKDQGGNNIA